MYVELYILMRFLKLKLLSQRKAHLNFLEKITICPTYGINNDTPTFSE